MELTGAICISFVIVLVSSLAWTNAAVEEGVKVACVPAELKPCTPAGRTGSNPSTECCRKLKEQVSCLCSYMKNPAFGHCFQTPNALKVIAACSIPYPTC
ncbi:unnamed protein product [Eruca vesicaria subsp. sativa]|uniref:Bifunctional inhibitor/plant lipid transfer protein/seed storage helical domain-containing protein n=1 Tax=Eruca vesicaria subsp. sativa TaxID=29727 RepID=A0ABC8LP26_ERUVS|nr:unnamed protein product [Eruca vesicaria subsp. sativa]